MSFAVNPLSKVGEYRLEHMAKKKIPIDQIGALRFAFRKSSESHKSHPFCHWSFKSMLTVQILFKRIVIPPKYLIVSWRIQSSKSAKEIGILLSDNPSMMACLKNWGFPDETFGFKFQVPSSKNSQQIIDSYYLDVHPTEPRIHESATRGWKTHHSTYDLDDRPIIQAWQCLPPLRVFCSDHLGRV